MMTFYSSVVVLLFLCCFCEVSINETQNHGFTVELIHPNSPKSPIYNIMESELERVSKVMQHSMNRIHYFNHVFFSSPNNNMPESTITPYLGQAYVMSYSIGTPPFQLYGGLDTGSDLIWFQCKPCKPCYNQTSPMFDPLKSSTYKTIRCTSPTCKYVVEKGNCSSNKKDNCEYNNVYDDMSSSQGDLSVETLTLNSNDGSPISFPRIVIGCGRKNNLPIDGIISGIVGLGRGRLSLISQLSSSIGGKFSYCLVPYFSKPHTSSKLHFGNRATVSGPGTVSTPLLQGFIDNFYITALEAFSVGNEIIKLEQSTFGKGNTVIDSGSTITSLPQDVYSKLEDAVATMVKLKRVKDPTQQFSLCYKTTLEMLKVPIITAHFRGADVKLNAFNTFFQTGHEVWCFAFVTGGHFPGVILGNVAQQNFLVGFDLQKNIVSFKPADCTKQ
ncbi:aspartic proteinase CDR1 [Trifolium repens]|nr:aspartic proteinase CDR1 [Trifolium repens]